MTARRTITTLAGLALLAAATHPGATTLAAWNHPLSALVAGGVLTGLVVVTLGRTLRRHPYAGTLAALAVAHAHRRRQRRRSPGASRPPAPAAEWRTQGGHSVAPAEQCDGTTWQ